MRPPALPVALAAALGIPFACGPPSEVPRDLVIVVLDALPADGLGCHGYARPVSPRIDAFAAEGVRCALAVAPSTYTLASSASLFTGLAPAGHGVLGGKSNVLHDGHLTLAEALAAAGFATAAFSCNPNVAAEAGFDQGFETFELRWRDRFDSHTVPAGVVDDVLAWWDGAAGRPRFAYVHLLPPHQPYDAPAPHRDLFGAGETPREEGMTDFLVDRRAAGPLDPEAPLARRVRARYDAGLHHADAVFGALLDGLDARGAADGAAIALLSDHGEAFGEHGDILHGGAPFRELAHVPLIVRAPGLAPGVRSGLVRTRDLAATMSALLGASWPERPSRGSSFLPLLRGGATPSDLVAVSRSAGDRPVWTLRTERWTLVRHGASDTSTLYDRETDPFERVDVAAANLDLLAQLDAQLNARLAQDRDAFRLHGLEGGSVSVWKAALRDLGYASEDPGED